MRITDTTEIQRIVKNNNNNNYEQLYSNKSDNLGEIDKFLETCNLPKLNKEKSENLNRKITTSKMEAVIKKKNLQTNKSPGPNSFTSEFYQTFKEELRPLLPNYSKMFNRREDIQAHFTRPALS